MDSKLIDDRPIMFLPKLAKALGSCERAIVLQQIHWLLRQPHSGVWVEGLHWVWGTYENWCRDYFSMWSPHTLTKVIRKLEASGVLISAQLRAKEHDRTKFYRINYVLLDSMLPDQVVSKPPDQVGSNPPDAVASNPPNQVGSINRTETSTENTQIKKGASAPKKKRSYNPEDYEDL